MSFRPDSFTRWIKRVFPNRTGNVGPPEGFSFLELVWKQEDDCESWSDKLIPNLGQKAPACLEGIGTVLSLLDRLASCWWGCQTGDHRIERICGRVASNGRAALRLLRLGFYDEALVLCRAMGEAANLLQLFASDAESLREWRALDPQHEKRKFSPVKVRLRLEGISTQPFVDEARYRKLSRKAAHVNNATLPQNHNFAEVPVAGSSRQTKGVLLCLNELALPLGLAAAFGEFVLEHEDDVKERIVLASSNLIRQIGGVNIMEIQGLHSNLVQDFKLSEESEPENDS